MMMNNNKYQVVDQQLVNAGGGNFVEVATVIDKQQADTIYVYVDIDGYTVTSVDFIQIDVNHEVVSKAVITNGTLRELYADAESDKQLTEVIKSVWLAYIRSYCSKFKKHEYIEAEILPIELKMLVTTKYLDWLEENGQCVKTDGYTVIKSSFYPADCYLIADVKNQYNQAAHDLIDYLDDLLDTAFESGPSDIDKIFDDDFTFSHNELTVKLPFCPVTFDGIMAIAKEWLEENED